MQYLTYTVQNTNTDAEETVHLNLRYVREIRIADDSVIIRLVDGCGAPTRTQLQKTKQLMDQLKRLGIGVTILAPTTYN